MADASESATASRAAIGQRLRCDPRLARLTDAQRDEIAQRIVAAAPFRNAADLKQRIANLRIAGVKRQDRDAVAEVICSGLRSRRQWIAALGAGGLAAGAFGTVLLDATPPPLPERRGDSIRPLVAALQQQQAPTGTALGRFLKSAGSPRTKTSTTTLDGLLHALDMSNWLEAALHLDDQAVRAALQPTVADAPFGGLVGALVELRRAWRRLLAERETWRQQFFMAYAFGKLPSLASAAPEEPPYDAARTLRGLGPVFHALEILNQRFLPPGRTRWGAPVRVTQGHNISYAHLAGDLRRAERFDPGRKVVLVNWDAHADLGRPFENSRMPLARPMEMLDAASSFDERVVVASSMSIAGWILPLLQQGVLHRGEQPAELVWVVPPEAAKTSSRYLPPYGTYEMLVGTVSAPDASGDLLTYSSQERLRQVPSPDRLSDGRACRVHVVSPDNLDAIEPLLRDKQIALSIDVDFAGTREPGVLPRRGSLPHYPLNKTQRQQARHHALIHQAGVFYDRWQQSVRSVTIANSPNFTVDEATRQPLAQVLHEFANAGLAETPAWLEGELRREAPRQHDLAAWVNRGLAYGGWCTAGFAAFLAGREWTQRKQLRGILGEESA